MAPHERNNPKPIPFIPEEIINKVFLKLPVEDLLRSKVVCKSWLSLISSSDFIKNHLAESTKDPHFTLHHFLLGCRPLRSPFQLQSYSIYSLLNNEPVNEPVHHDDYPDRIRCVVGCCMGLICLESYDNYLFFWNPSTRQTRRLPILDTISTSDDMFINYGFCYDESNDEFKVFAISTYWQNHMCMSVYSSKSNFWRFIGHYASDYSVLYGGYMANGALHWVVYPKRQLSRNSMKIISLDIKTETCEEILWPNCGEGEYTRTMANFGENLSVLCNMYEDSRADLWVLKKRDMEESWVKLFTIRNMDNRLKQHSYIQPMCISVNGDMMLIHLDLTIVLYNLKDHTFKDLPNNIRYESLKVYTYVESLVSPHLPKLANTRK